MIRKTLPVLVAAMVLAVVGCSGSSGSGGSGGSGGGLKIGILADLTGVAASGNATTPQGVQAGIAAAKAGGVDLTSVSADTSGGPSGALAAAQQLVQQDHVDVIIANSSVLYAAAPYLHQQGVPVIGLPEDGPEWQTMLNMFPLVGAIHLDKVTTTAGKVLKSGGATTVGAIGYGVSPTSSMAAKGAAASAHAVGLKVGYLNPSLQFGSTNVGAVALAMKNKGVDGANLSVDPNTSFAVIDAMKQAGAPLKIAYLATGYGGDLLQAGPNTLKSAKGVYFILPYQPVELKTPATQRFQRYLTQVGVKGEPTFAEYNGYVSVLLLLQGLKAAGTNSPSQAKLISALSTITKFPADGLFGDHPANPNDRTNVVDGPDNCLFVTKFNGTGFTVQNGGKQICGQIVPGVKIS